jgi:heme exporter protein D
MSSWGEFISMGGYAAYVWPAYGLALFVLIANAVQPGRHLRRKLADLKQRASKGGGI